MFKFGLNFENKDVVAHWGARAIGLYNQIDILPDRQQFSGEPTEDFRNWINLRALPVLREAYKKNPENDFVLKEYKYELRGVVSGGYMMLGAVEHKVKESTPYYNKFTQKDERVVEVDGQKFVLDREIPIGSKGMVNVNSIGEATAYGYYEENYVDDLKLVCIQVLFSNPPEWWLTQTKRSDARKLMKAGLLPKSKNFDSVDEKSKEYKEWAKNWKPQIVPIWASDFKEV